MVTAKKLMSVADVTRRTLSNWQSAGLIPAPVRETGRSGRGSVGVWPDDTMEIVAFIKKEQANGHSFDEIKHMLNNRGSIPLGSVSKEAREMLRRFDEVQAIALANVVSSGSTVRQALQQALAHGLCKMLNDVDANAIAERVVRDEYLGWSLQLAMAGYSPVLVVVPGDEVYITPDFLVDQELGARGEWLTGRDLSGGMLSQVEHQERIADYMSARLIMPLHLYLRLACTVFGIDIGRPSVFAAKVVEIVKWKKHSREHVDATVHVDYSIVQTAPGPYGRLVFSLRPTTERVAVIGNAFI